MNKVMFVGYEISPVAEVGEGTVEAFDTIAAAKAAATLSKTEMFWSIYGRFPDGRVGCIADRKEFEDACNLYTLITGHPGPVEAARYIDLPASNPNIVPAQRDPLLKVLSASESPLMEAMHVHVSGEPDLKDIPVDSPYLVAHDEIRQPLRKLHSTPKPEAELTISEDPFQDGPKL